MAQPPDEPPARKKAVAVESRAENELPVITAAGRGKLAERILDIAFDNDVRVRQDSELVEILDAYEVDSPIPLEALTAISEILRYIYAENARMSESPDQADDADDGSADAPKPEES